MNIFLILAYSAITFLLSEFRKASITPKIILPPLLRSEVVKGTLALSFWLWIPFSIGLLIFDWKMGLAVVAVAIFYLWFTLKLRKNKLRSQLKHR